MSKSYILKTGEEALEILEFQHKYLAKSSYDQLDRAKLHRGQVVWDVGCGVGIMTEYLAKAVGEDGKVYAFDVSDEQLDVTKQRILKSGLNNVIFLKGSITEIDNLPINSADIVYSRLLLMHLQTPEKAIKKMYSLLKPNGVLLLQESTISTSHISKGGANLDDYFQTLINIGKNKGVDYNIGVNLPFLCKKIGYTEIEHYTSVYKHSAREAKHMLLTWLMAWQDTAIDYKLITKEKIDTWKSKILSFPDDDTSIYFTGAEQTHVLIWKR
jgi:ubiquinone/menaquinone biosynthesis C-methylase UbiE